MCGMTRLSVCQSVDRRTAEGGKGVQKREKRCTLFFFLLLAVLFELCFQCCTVQRGNDFVASPPALLVNLQLKAKHVLVASKCLFGAHPRCPEAFSKSSLRCPCICVCLSARPSSRCASFGQVEDTANGQGQQHVLLEYAIPREAWRWNRE